MGYNQESNEKSSSKQLKFQSKTTIANAGEVCNPQSAEPVFLPPPPFTIKEIRDAIPAHCFERSLFWSSVYLSLNLAIIGVVFYLSTFIDYAPFALQCILWPISWIVQGCFATGIWVIGHECGHQSFSPWKSVNNAVGIVLHSALLVPYHSWRITHGMHHKATAHMDKDQVFVPYTRSEVAPHTKPHEEVSEMEDVPIVVLLKICRMLFFGWWAYLSTNITGQKYDRRANHFEPSSPIFKKEHRNLIILSDIALIVVISILGYFGYKYSFGAVIKYHFIPYVIVNFWLVMITYLHHTDKRIPHLRDDEWSFVRGALCTVDRNYGILNSIFHHITDTHVAHHLFSTMPHYHAVEATKHLQKLLGEYYNSDETNVFKSLWQSYYTCHFVENEGKIVFYKSLWGKKEQ